MQNPKTGGSRWVPDIRPENIDTYTEQNENQSAEYKIVDAHPIIGGVLDKLAFFRTHASAVWYNKMKNITVLQKLDNLASNIGVLANLATTDKTSLVNAVNELNVKMGEKHKWKFLSLQNLSTTDVQISIPETAEEVMIFAGAPNPGNEFQVYGGKSYIIPLSQKNRDVVYEQSIYNADGSVEGSGFYAMWTNDILVMHVKTTPVRARVYYR